MSNEIFVTINNFYRTLNDDDNHRYKSWEHCYSLFRNHDSFMDINLLDLACLNLGFYLASWGMYRGSSDLLWKDYKIYKDIIKVLIDEDYDSIWDINILDFSDESQQIKSIFKLRDTLKMTFRNIMKEVNGKQKKFNASDTLITKILMGTLGCVPAYDRLFKNGCKKAGVKPYSNFSKKSYLQLVKFYKDNVKEFNLAYESILKKSSIQYPAMKLVDMYFWKIGSEKSY